VTGETPGNPTNYEIIFHNEGFSFAPWRREVGVLSRFRSNHIHTRRPENVGRVPLFSVDYPARIWHMLHVWMTVCDLAILF